MHRDLMTPAGVIALNRDLITPAGVIAYLSTDLMIFHSESDTAFHCSERRMHFAHRLDFVTS